jgi:hypothetical protein
VEDDEDDAGEFVDDAVDEPEAVVFLEFFPML